MRIVYVSDQYWPLISGVSVSINAFRKELERLGNEIFLIVPDYPGAKELDAKENQRNIFRFSSFKLFFSKINRMVYLTEKRNVFRKLDELNPDIIHVQTEFMLGKIGIAYARKHNIPVYMTAHTNWEELISSYFPFIPHKLSHLYCRYRMHKIFNKVDIVITPTELMKDLLREHRILKPIRVIPTGIVKSQYAEVNKKREDLSVFQEYPRLLHQRILLFAGRLASEKNIPFLVDVLQKILYKIKNVTLVIAGDGPAREKLKDYVAKKNLQDHVIFTGFVSQNKLTEWYSAADCFVFASKAESQGLVVLEAMACGTPIVAIGKMGTLEVMSGDNGGYMVDDDIYEFVEKTLLIITNEAIRMCKSIEARSYVDDWSMEISGNRLHYLYQAGLLSHRMEQLERHMKLEYKA